MNANRITRWRGATLVVCFIACSTLLIPVQTSAQSPEDWCCEGWVGDADMSGAVDITDLSVMIDYMYLTLTPLQCWGEADLDLDYRVDIADLSTLIEYFSFTEIYLPDCPAPPPFGSMQPLSGCKTQKAVEGESCIIWEYDGQGELSIQHTNATLNCCPEEEASVTIAGGQMTINETVIDGLCLCVCLFDVDFTVSNLQPGEYTIVVNEPYWQAPQETFEFVIDLNTSPTGMVCIERNLGTFDEF